MGSVWRRIYIGRRRGRRHLADGGRGCGCEPAVDGGACTRDRLRIPSRDELQIGDEEVAIQLEGELLGLLGRVELSLRSGLARGRLEVTLPAGRELERPVAHGAWTSVHLGGDLRCAGKRRRARDLLHLRGVEPGEDPRTRRACRDSGDGHLPDCRHGDRPGRSDSGGGLTEKGQRRSARLFGVRGGRVSSSGEPQRMVASRTRGRYPASCPHVRPVA
jgi:hypothetical protein